MCNCPFVVKMTADYPKMGESAMIDNLMTVESVAEYLGVPAATVYQWNSRGQGPRRYRLGKHVRYRRADVDLWVDRQVAPVPMPA